MFKHVITTINCIVGVSVLAMPFCFKQCGVVLASILLLLSGIMTRTVCYFLLKASTITRRRTYELLAYHTFGQAGKLVVEISIIGFLIGTLIAFLVVMGDLGPEILSDVFNIENNPSLRSIIMTALSLFVALPLGLLRNIDSLNAVSTVTMLFYVFLVFKILSDGMGPLWSGSFLTKINYWRPAGVLQCIPIFSMALSCQTQIFGIYDSLPDPSLQKMHEVIKKAINMCTFFYITVGFLGYIAFCTQNFGGNILLSFGASWSTQVIKICFILSIAFSFPLVIFPCRASLHSLIFKRDHLHHHLHDITTNYIPESRLKVLTVGIIMFTLFVGLLIPNIELVLGIVGSTTGSVICIIFPSIMFIRVTSKNTTERLLAQTVFGIGIIIMVVTTFVTLAQVNDSSSNNSNSGDGPEILKSFDNKINNIDTIGGENMRLAQIPIINKDDGSRRETFVNPPISIDSDKNRVIEGVVKSSNFDPVVKSEGREVPVPAKEKPPNTHADSSKPSTRNVTFTKLKSPSPQHYEIKSKLDPDNEKVKVIQNNQQEEVINIPIKNDDHSNEVLKKEAVISHHQVDESKKVQEKPARASETNKVINIAENIGGAPKIDGGVLSNKLDVGAKVVDNSKDKQEPLSHNEAPIVKTNGTLASGAKEEPNENKLKEETLLKKLQEHEEQQRKLLDEQKAILEKLKEHQAEDELKQKNTGLSNQDVDADTRNVNKQSAKVVQEENQEKKSQVLESIPVVDNKVSNVDNQGMKLNIEKAQVNDGNNNNNNAINVQAQHGQDQIPQQQEQKHQPQQQQQPHENIQDTVNMPISNDQQNKLQLDRNEDVKKTQSEIKVHVESQNKIVDSNDQINKDKDAKYEAEKKPVEEKKDVEPPKVEKKEEIPIQVQAQPKPKVDRDI